MASGKLIGSLIRAPNFRSLFYANLSYSKVKSFRSLSETTGVQKELDPAGDCFQVDKIDPFGPVLDEQRSFVDNISPPLKRSYNLASYVNSSKTLQELIKAGVSLYDIENLKPNAANHLLQLDYERDCVKYMKFLTDSGLKPANIGRFISEFPEIFQVPVLELQTRLHYLRTKKFDSKQIARALNRSAHILNKPVKTMDHKLGEFQIQFDMPAQIIREIISSYPVILSYPALQYTLVQICLTDEFGFHRNQVHQILEQQPKIVGMKRAFLFERLDLIHNEAKMSHEIICQFPKLITGPDLDIRQRLLYLRKLRRDQFNRDMPLYVQPAALYNGSDEEFCQKYAKTSLNDYKLFVKTCL